MKCINQSEGNKMKRKINSEFDKRVISVLSCLVPDQYMELKETSSGNLQLWKSTCKDVDNQSITTITRDSETVAKVIYDYETGEEKSFFY